jgi:signal transduction histidine kinase
VIYLETSAAPVMDTSGRLLGYRGADNDITERKQMEARIGDLYQQEKLHREKLQDEARVKNLFIDVLAHELRNSMTSIVVSSDMLRDGREMGADIKNRLVINVNDGAKALTRRLDELLDLARYSKGTFVLNKQKVNGPVYIREVISRFKPNLDKRQQTLIIDISPDLHSVNIDVSRMEQVIVNLLSNASKYSSEKSEIVVKACPKDHGLFLEVIDHGIGISNEDQSRIFQPYYRACKSQDIQGIGLGMAVSHQIVQAHGGSITVASRLGEGSTFSVLIPEAS